MSSTLTLSERSDYAHVDGVALFYGLGSGAFTVTAVLKDTLAGMAQVTFPDTTSPGAGCNFEGDASATRSHTYTFTAASTFSAVPAVAAADRATNESQATFRVMRDAAPPEVWLDAPPRIYSGATSIPVTRGATDDASGVAHYDVQVQVEDGPWTDWLTGTMDTSAAYALEEGQWFSFRVTATDNVGNQASVETSSHVACVRKYYYHGGQRVAMRAGGVVYYLHGDHLGSTSLTTDGSGAVVARQFYHPYGTVRWQDGTLPTDFGFTGQRHDGSTGLVFMHARYYHPALGRFTQADTIVPSPGNPQDFNRYAYTRNNPVLYTDPSGHAVDHFRNSRYCGPYPPGGEFDPEKVREVAMFWAVSVPVVVYGGPLLGDLAGAAFDAATLGYLRLANAHPLLTKLLLGVGGSAVTAELSDADDDEVRAAQRLWRLRQAYEGQVREIGKEAERRLTEGQSPEEVARWAHGARRGFGEAFKNTTPPDLLEQIYARNIEKYGDPLGPSVEWLLEQGKTWEDMIESAARSGGADIIPRLLESSER